MKILWIVNMLLPDAADHLGVQTGASGTWMIDISHALSTTPDIELAVACVYGNEYKKFKHNSITYYLLPGTGKNMLFYTKKYEKIWAKINEDFAPDIVHLHGTEYSHGLSFMRACPDVKSVISIQGILNKIKDVDFGEIPLRHFIFGRTLRQNLHMSGEIELHLIHKRNAKYEREMLKRAKYINGVNTWDISLCKSINPDLKTFKIEYNLREGFYEARKWSADAMQRHSIFTNPAGVPLKGLHMLLRAIALIKPQYPDVKVYVPGMAAGNGKLAVTGAYAKYISKLISKLGIEENVEFVGRLNEQEMIERMLNSNAVVIPSAIEGTSLILREAMYLGCPCVASFRGGMCDFVSDREDGFLYDFSEYPFLATRLMDIFEGDKLCIEMSKKAIAKTELAHDREVNKEKYLKMYNFILND